MDKKQKFSRIISFRLTEKEYKKIQIIINQKQINKSDAMRKIIAESVSK